MIRFILCAAALISAPAMATEWFVSPSGTDANGSGTFERPFRSVRYVLNPSNNIVRAGDIVTLRAGTYNECDVRLRKRLTLRSYGTERARIHCAITTPNSVTIQIDTGASGSRVAGLEITGGMYYGIQIQTDWYPDACCENGQGPSDIILEDLKIHDTGRDGIKITPMSRDIIIRRNEIYKTGVVYPAGTDLESRNADGIDSVNAHNLLIEDNYIHDISTTGLYFKGGAMDVVVQRNRIENTGMGGILAGFDTSVEFFDRRNNPQFYESIRGIVRNNVIRNTDYEGIGLYAAKDALIANNTIVNTARLGHSAIYFGVPVQDWDPSAGRPSSVNPTIRNNLVIQNGGRCIEIRYWNELGGVSGLSGNPNSDYNAFHNMGGACVFNDARPGSAMNGSGNLDRWRNTLNSDRNSITAVLAVDASGHIAAGSPAIKAGTYVAQVTDDIDGDPRYAPYDIGADELSTGVVPDNVFASGFD